MRRLHVKLSKCPIIATECQCTKMNRIYKRSGIKITKVQWSNNHQDEAVHADSVGIVDSKWESGRYIVDS